MTPLILADVMISGQWLTGIVVAIIGALGGVYLKARKDGENSRSVTLNPPVPRFDVTTKEDPEYVTHNQLNGHLDRIEATFEDIKNALDGERGIARVANGNLHKRIDAMSEKFGDRLSKLEGTSQSVKETVDKLLDIALGKIKPTSRQ